jgi:hypothetical protein
LFVGCGIGLREADVPTPAFLIVAFGFSIARPSLNFSIENRRSKSPKILDRDILRRFSVARGDAVDPDHREKSLRLVKARSFTAGCGY